MMKQMRNIIITVCYLFLASFLTNRTYAQLKIGLSLQQAIDLSLKNSKQLKISKSRIDIATASLLAAQNNKLPNFNISGSYLRVLQPNIDLQYKNGTANSSGGGNQPAPFPKVNQAAYGIANISYPIYSGGKIKYGIESAKYLQEASILDEGNDKDAIALNAINAFINIYKAKLTVQIFKNNLKVSKQRDSTFARLEQNGILARNDLLKTQLQTSNIELNLLEAESNLQLAAINMNLMLGINGNTVPDIDTTALIILSPMSLDEYVNNALHTRKDIAALELRKKAAALALKSARSDGYPSIALTGGYIAAYIPKFITISNAIDAGIGLQYNLASLWKSNSRLMEAKARDAEIISNQQILNDAISYQVNQAYLAYTLSRKKIEVYKKALMQASENYRITKNKFDNSLVTMTELLEADLSNQQAELNLTIARADEIAAYNKLNQAAGILKY